MTKNPDFEHTQPLGSCNMNSTTNTPPYSVSTGAAFAAFNKLKGAENYVTRKQSMRTVLHSLRQRGLITGIVVAPVTVETVDETKAVEAFEVRRISAFMEISFRIADSAKSALGHTENPKAAWELLEKRFGATQQGYNSYS